MEEAAGFVVETSYHTQCTMRVIHLTSVHNPRDSRICEKECTSLAQAGHQVVLVVPGERDEKVNGVQIRTVRKSGGRLSRMTCCVWRVYSEARRQNGDVYHFHDPELIPAALLLRLQGKRVIYDVHEDLPRTIQYKPYLPVWLARPIKCICQCLEWATAGYFTAIVAATTEIGARLCRINPHTVVVSNFPLLDGITSTAGQSLVREPTVTYVGSITEARGIRELVQAMALLPRAVPVRLALAGAFDPPELKQEVAKLPGWERVDYLGMLDRTGVINLLGRVQAGLVVLHDTPNYVSAWPIKLFEYMRAGIPVIASHFPLWRGIVGGSGCGLLVDPADPQAIANAIIELFTHPNEANQMGERGQARVATHYNWKTEEAKLVGLYASLENGA